MKELVETYSIEEILLFLITFAFSIRGFVSFWDWAYERLRKVFKKESDKESKMDSIQEKIHMHEKEYNVLRDNQTYLQETLVNLIGRVNLLIDSDKDDIKSFITERHHHFCYKEGWIDDYSLDCIEKRFKHYTDEGGNSFVEDLMGELRNLPKHPPRHEED